MDQAAVTNTPASPQEYERLLKALKERIRSAQFDALRVVNQGLIALYMDIGRMIVEKQQGDTWGKSVVGNLARDLREEFPGANGFSAANLWRMKTFYEAYQGSEKLAQIVREIGWSHNITILEKCKVEEEREFYIRSCRKYGWTRDVLVHQIENHVFHRTLNSQTNFESALPESVRIQAKLAVKDEYTFAFLDLENEHSEKELERALTGRVESFLREMGDMFTFVGSQYRVQVGEREFFIDLLLYHRRLRALVALELKIGEFEPEFIGKMQFYLSVLDETVRLPDEQPSIGIILCKSKNRLVVEYALKQSSAPIGVSAYSVTPDVPRDLQGQLPSPGQVASLLSGFDEDA
jgi:predicted nuclease of restriction endonuclease-like (RecB) superfamily